MNYKRKIEKKINDLVMGKGFKYLGDLIYEREINDIVQYLSIDIHRSYKRISPWYKFNKLMPWKYYSQLEEYYFQDNEEFEELVNELYVQLETKVLPHYDDCANEFRITRSMVKRVKEETDELVELYLQEYKEFPKDIEELIRNVRDYYHRYKSEEDEKNRELICVVSAVYCKYLLSYKSSYELMCSSKYDFIRLFDSDINEMINPILTSYSSFITDDYDEFKGGNVINLLGGIGYPEWVKKEKWEQIVF